MTERFRSLRGPAILAALGALGALTVGGALASTASAHLGFVCNGAGTLRVEPTSPRPTWRVEGSGRCLDVALAPAGEARELTFEGKGTSAPFTCQPGLLGVPSMVTTGLRLNVEARFEGAASGRVVTQKQEWLGPLTLNRLITPTLVVKPGLGASISLHRIFLGCGNDGIKPAATFDFVTLLDRPG